MLARAAASSGSSKFESCERTSRVRSTGQGAIFVRNICSAYQHIGEKKLQSSRGRRYISVEMMSLGPLAAVMHVQPMTTENAERDSVTARGRLTASWLHGDRNIADYSV